MKIKDISKKAPKIRDTSKHAEKLDPEDIARRLGGEFVAKVNARPGFWGAILTYLRLRKKKK